MNDYPPEKLLYYNKSIGILKDSPILEDSITVDSKLEILSKSSLEDTKNQYIRFEIPLWTKLNKRNYLKNMGIAVGITLTAMYLLYSNSTA